jgi:hypothetical protein
VFENSAGVERRGKKWGLKANLRAAEEECRRFCYLWRRRDIVRAGSKQRCGTMVLTVVVCVVYPLMQPRTHRQRDYPEQVGYERRANRRSEIVRATLAGEHSRISGKSLIRTPGLKRKYIAIMSGVATGRILDFGTGVQEASYCAQFLVCTDFDRSGWR